MIRKVPLIMSLTSGIRYTNLSLFLLTKYTVPKRAQVKIVNSRKLTWTSVLFKSAIVTAKIRQAMRASPYKYIV